MFDDSKGMADKEIQKIEEFTKFTLPLEIVELFKNNSGGSVKNNQTYFLGWTTDRNVNLDTWITSVETKDSIFQNWKHRGYLIEYLDWFEISENYVEVELLFPIFELIDGVIYVAIGGNHDKKVYYADNGAEGILNIASNLQEFYSNLNLKIL